MELRQPYDPSKGKSTGVPSLENCGEYVRPSKLLGKILLKVLRSFVFFFCLSATLLEGGTLGNNSRQAVCDFDTMSLYSCTATGKESSPKTANTVTLGDSVREGAMTQKLSWAELYPTIHCPSSLG